MQPLATRAARSGLTVDLRMRADAARLYHEAFPAMAHFTRTRAVGSNTRD